MGNNKQNSKTLLSINKLGSKLFLGSLHVLVKFLPEGGFEQDIMILSHLKVFPVENMSFSLLMSLVTSESSEKK